VYAFKLFVGADFRFLGRRISFVEFIPFLLLDQRRVWSGFQHVSRNIAVTRQSIAIEFHNSFMFVYVRLPQSIGRLGASLPSIGHACTFNPPAFDSHGRVTRVHQATAFVGLFNIPDFIRTYLLTYSLTHLLTYF